MFLLTGHLLDTPAPGALRHVPGGALVVDDDGTIATTGPESEIRADPRWKDARRLSFPDESIPVIISGLIDIHAHLPQYPAVARVEDGLLPWLNRYIFPLEKNFRGDKSGGPREAIDAFFDALASNGTTTAVLYSAIWEDSCDLAFEIAAERGLRIIMGKVMMDEGTYGDLAPEPTREISLTETGRLLEKWHGANKGLLEYAVSPRFAVTCSRKLMIAAGELARKHGAYIQTHLSENPQEIATVRERFPDAEDYTAVYEECGLLGPRTILGHCIHLSRREIDSLAARDARVAHCPTSNFFLNSGLCPLDRLRAAGLKIGLGSDVAAGPELNLWQVMRSAIEVRKARRFAGLDHPAGRAQGASGCSVTLPFHLATLGGAEVLGKEAAIGTLDPGKEADLAVFDLNAVLPYRGRFQDTGNFAAEEILAQLIYRGGPHAHLATFVRGRRIDTPQGPIPDR